MFTESSLIYDAVSLSVNQSSSSSCSASNSNSSSSGSAVPGSDVIVLLWQICGPILLLVGFVGNILVLITMTRRRMRNTSTCVYLVGMAAIDLVVLIVGLIPGWLEGANIVVIKNLDPVVCKLQKFLDYTSGDAAVWLRMAFTIDRLIAVLFPLYSGTCCGRPSSARMYVMAACVIAVAKDVHVFWTRGAEFAIVYDCTENGTQVINGTRLVSNCGYPTAQYKNFELYVRPWIAFALVSVGPFGIIAICNTLILASLVRRRRNMSGSTRKSVSTKRSMSSSSQEQQFFQMAAMCVAASGLFLVCTAPTIVMLIGKPYWTAPPGPSAAYEISKAVTGILFYVTFSANFFLYCLTGKRFRTTLFGLCSSRYRALYSSVRRSAYRPTDRQSKIGSKYGNPSSSDRQRSNYPATRAIRVSANSRMTVGSDEPSSVTEMTQVSGISETDGSIGRRYIDDDDSPGRGVSSSPRGGRSSVVQFSTPFDGLSAVGSRVQKDTTGVDNIIKRNGATDTSC